MHVICRCKWPVWWNHQLRDRDNESVITLDANSRKVNLFCFVTRLGLLLIACSVIPLPTFSATQDDVIYDRVIRKLVNDPRLKTNTLDVIVSEGLVTVKGVVETEKLRGRVNKIIRKIKGVKKVVNQVHVRR